MMMHSSFTCSRDELAPCASVSSLYNGSFLTHHNRVDLRVQSGRTWERTAQAIRGVVFGTEQRDGVKRSAIA